MTGKVTFVGAGSGDPRLLTVRGAEVVATADLLLFDPEVHPEVLRYAPEGVVRAAVLQAQSAEDVAAALADAAKQGKHAVRVMWGDPLFFERGEDEASAVARRGVALEIVPGVGALVAASAFAGIPLTRSGDVSQSVAAVRVTKGHESLHDWAKLATATETLAILCDADSVADTARSLVFYGRSPSEVLTVIEHVSLPSQRVTQSTLDEVPVLPKSSASRVVLVVGARARPLPYLQWFERRPLFGRRILVTRSKEQAGGLAALLRERGADVVLMPTIEIHAPSDPSPMIDVVSQIGTHYRWVVFTSVNGVERLWDEVRRQGRDARIFGAAKIAAVGPGTAAALLRCGLFADLVAKERRGEGLAADLLAAIGDEKPRVLIARAEVARDVVPDALRAAGCEVDVVAVYKTRSPPRALLEGLSALLDAGEIDAVTFTSSSTVDHLCEALEARAVSLLAKAVVASIGPVTTETATKFGVRVDLTAHEQTMAALAEDLEGHFARFTKV